MNQQLQLVDLGDAKVETRQWGMWPLYYDSIFLFSERP